MDFKVTMVRFNEAVEIAHTSRTGLSAAGTSSQRPAKMEIQNLGLLITMEGDTVLVPWANVRQASMKALE
jgi:hypothetical protein